MLLVGVIDDAPTNHRRDTRRCSLRQWRLSPLKSRNKKTSDGNSTKAPAANASISRRNVASGAQAFAAVTSGVTRFGYLAQRHRLPNA